VGPEASAFLTHFGKGSAAFVLFIATWEVLRAAGTLSSQWAPSFFEIAGAIFSGITGGTLVPMLGQTLFAWLLGLAIAALIGIIWGVVISLSEAAAACSRILMRFLRPIPSVALIPVAILLAGLNMRMVVFLVVFASVWPVLFNTIYAMREVPELYRETAKALGLNAWQIQLKVMNIAILPGVLTGVRVAGGIALVVAISAELVTGIGGLGGYIMEARVSGNMAATYAAVVIGGLLGTAISLAFAFVQKQFLQWSPDNREASA
jgi:ABC-type nitrate/sulfonate/bicarbonate transport system permease component